MDPQKLQVLAIFESCWLLHDENHPQPTTAWPAHLQRDSTVLLDCSIQVHRFTSEGGQVLVEHQDDESNCLDFVELCQSSLRRTAQHN